MKLYDYYFFRMFKSTNTTNKSIPEWSSIITMSILWAINIFSVLVYFDFPIKETNKNVFGACFLTIIALHYLYFLSKNRYLKIIKRFTKSKYNKNLFHDILIVFYACASIFIFFKLLGIEMKYSIGLSLFVICTSVFGYFKGRNDNKNSN